jgi:FkbM family methyltransferase
MHAPLDLPPYKTVDCKHGRMSYFDEDELIGLALKLYGEYSEGEVEVFRKILKPGDVALDVGANIGAFTVPMAKLVGDTGKVYAFEASEKNVELLRKNVVDNDLEQVRVIGMAASDTSNPLKVSRLDAFHNYTAMSVAEESIDVAAMRIDDLDLKKCKLIKIDVDRHELQVIRGARETIMRCRPILYVENEDDNLREALVAEIVSLGYRLYWHRPFQFHKDNFRGENRNFFGRLLSLMNVCVPDEAGYELPGLDEVADLRDDDLMFDREIARMTKYVERDPNDLNARMMIGYYENLMQRPDKADAALHENIRRNPAHLPTLGVQGLLALQRKDYRTGWPAYELRFNKSNLLQFGGDRLHDCDKWDGSPTDKPLLIWTEQGWGDNIMFARFMKHVLERAPNAFLEVRPELYELFEYSNVVPQGRLFRHGRTLPHYELHCSLPSVAGVLGADDDMIAVDGAYLFADPMLVKNWRGKGHVRLAQTQDPLMGARIGLCRRGSVSSERPYTRDIPDQLLLRLERDLGPFFPLGQQFESFMTTAGAVKALDLVITVDTSVAHLAGALGVPTWLLLSFDPDWRWGLKDDTSVWYPSMRIYRQPKFRDWQSVIDNVYGDLENYAVRQQAAE